MMNDLLEITKHAFDKISKVYDWYDNRNPILKWMRSIVHGVYLNEMKPGGSVLELNAGTGIDAVFLAQKGMKVFATDISDEMINVLKHNAGAHIENGSVKCAVKSFEEIDTINESGFDAVVSNFGGLNCINDFSKLSADLDSKLKPGGKFIAVVMNRLCPWEIFYYSIKFDFRKAFRRLNKNGIFADLNGEKVKTFYFSPGEFGKFFGSHFKTEKIYTLGYYTPPPFLIGIYSKLKPLVKLFMKIDELIMRLFPINRFGDHFIIVMRKK